MFTIKVKLFKRIYEFVTDIIIQINEIWNKKMNIIVQSIAGINRD